MQPESPKPSSQPPSQWQFVPEQHQGVQLETQASNVQDSWSAESQPTNEVHVAWTASEFIAYQKNAGWYLSTMMAFLGIIAVVYLLTRDIISAIVTFLLGILFIVFASRKPRVLNYEISDQGIQIGEKLYPFASLKSFAVIDEGAIHSIDLLPLQRFMPAVSMYYEPADEATIVQTLGSFLPKEERSQPLIDQLMHKIRF